MSENIPGKMSDFLDGVIFLPEGQRSHQEIEAARIVGEAALQIIVLALPQMEELGPNFPLIDVDVSAVGGRASIEQIPAIVIVKGLPEERRTVLLQPDGMYSAPEISKRIRARRNSTIEHYPFMSLRSEVSLSDWVNYGEAALRGLYLLRSELYWEKARTKD